MATGARFTTDTVRYHLLPFGFPLQVYITIPRLQGQGVFNKKVAQNRESKSISFCSIFLLTKEAGVYYTGKPAESTVGGPAGATKKERVTPLFYQIR